MAEHAPSYYAASCPPAPPRPALTGQSEADVCVVGAGFTGLSSALHLAGRGYRVVVLEANRIGWGASGRNGGQILPGFSASLAELAERHGEPTARRLWQLSLEAVALVRELAAAHAPTSELSDGFAYVATKASQLRYARAAHALIAGRWGYPHLRLIEQAEMPAIVDSRRYLGGLYDGFAAHFHPLRFAQGLAAAAETAGAVVHEGSPVIAVERGPGIVLRTATASVRARFAVFAGNAYLGRLLPPAEQRLLPILTFVLATAPLPGDLAKRLIPSGACVADMDTILDYYRIAGDRRLIFGGRVSMSGTPPPPKRSAALLQRRMVAVFPALAACGIDYVWDGKVALTGNRLPHFARLGANLFLAAGYSGHGVALATLAGKLIAEAVAGEAERFEVFARLKPPAFAGLRPIAGGLLWLATVRQRLLELLG